MALMAFYTQNHTTEVEEDERRIFQAMEDRLTVAG